MNKLATIIFGSLILSSCYTYQAYEAEAEVVNNKSPQLNTKLPSVRTNSQELQTVKPVLESSTSNNLIDIKPKTVIKEKEFYLIKTLGKETKIQAVKWEGDTLVAHEKGQPKNILKFHEKDIEDFKVRKFSKGRSDAMTIAAYATAGVGLFLLLK